MGYNIATDAEILTAAGVRASVAAKLLTNLGGLAAVASATTSELVAAGVPEKTAIRLRAAFEVGRRAVTRATDIRQFVATPADVHQLMVARGAVAIQQEVFYAVLIDVRNKILDVVEVARGTLTSVEVHPREAFRPAVRIAAAGVIFVHNHPSGDPTPSADDFAITKRLRQCGDLLGIPMLDHVVIATGGYRSIAELEP